MKTKIIFFSLLLLLIASPTKAQTWEFVGLDSMIIYGLEVRGDTIWAGTYDFSVNAKSGLYKSVDQGQSWVKIDSLLGNSAVGPFFIDKNNSSRIFIIKSFYSAGYFFKTSNNGLSWDSIAGYAQIKDFIISPIDSNEYYIITHSQGFPWPIVDLFYKSTDGGNTWEYKCCQSTPIYGLILTFAIDYTNPDNLYLSGYSNYEFFKQSTNRGDSWQDLSTPHLSKVFVDLFILNRIYLFGYQQQIFSNDGGITWHNMGGEYSSNAVFISLYQDDNTSVLYALTNEGLFYSDNELLFWRLIPDSETLPAMSTSDYSKTIRNISTDNNFIYTGSASGIYRTDFITGVDDRTNDLIPAEFHLSQNFPNPFNPATTINYSVPSSSNVSLIVYDVIGREVKTLVSGEKLPGNYNVQFDGSDLSSGVYFYVMRADNPSTNSGQSFIDTKKLILIK